MSTADEPKASEKVVEADRTHLTAATSDSPDAVVVTADRDLTTGRAADLLGVSRQYLLRLLDDDAIPSHLVGTHRRVRLDDLMQFKSRRDEQRRAALREMAREAEAARLYD